MLVPQRQWQGIRDGAITDAFRRWKRPTVKSGGFLQTGAGRLAIDEVEAISEDDVTAADAYAAGYESIGAAMAVLRPQGTLYRVRFHLAGDDPRVALRNDDTLDAETLRAITAQLSRLPWARPALELIDAQPATVSTVLAEEMGMERKAFKTRVRRLKSLGLTESLDVGYRLSPRGRRVLAHLRTTEPAASDA